MRRASPFACLYIYTQETPAFQSRPHDTKPSKTSKSSIMAGGMPVAAGAVVGGYLTGRALIVPLSLVISLFFLWGFSYGLLDGKSLVSDSDLCELG